jgi:hypothetical protein
MTDRIIVPPNTIHKVKPPMMSQSALYQLSRYCEEKDLRFGQALVDLLDFYDLFYMENRELERRIKDYINENPLIK